MSNQIFLLASKIPLPPLEKETRPQVEIKEKPPSTTHILQSKVPLMPKPKMGKGSKTKLLVSRVPFEPQNKDRTSIQMTKPLKKAILSKSNSKAILNDGNSKIYTEEKMLKRVREQQNILEKKMRKSGL